MISNTRIDSLYDPFRYTSFTANFFKQFKELDKIIVQLSEDYSHSGKRVCFTHTTGKRDIFYYEIPNQLVTLTREYVNELKIKNLLLPKV